MTSTTSETSTATATTVLPAMRTYTPKDPAAPISDGQMALMKRFGVRSRQSMTQGEANAALQRFFDKNPEISDAYLAEKAANRKAGWERKAKEYFVISTKRSQQTNRLRASEGQIRAVMAAAFVRRDLTEVQVIEARSMLQYGAGAAMASTFLNELPKREDQQQAN